MANVRRLLVRAAASRYFVGLALTAAIVTCSASRVQVISGTPTVYGQLYTQDVVSSTTLRSATATGGVLTLAADAQRFAPGQRVRVYLECAALSALPSGSLGSDWCAAEQMLAPVEVILQTVNASTGELTWRGWRADLPIAPLSGSALDSTVYGPGNLATDAAGRIYLADTWSSRIAVFDADGHPLYTVGHYGAVYSVHNDPTDADGDGAPDDSLYGYPGGGPGSVCYGPLGESSTGCTNNPAQQLGSLNTPNDVAVSADGQTIAVADSGNHRVVVFRRNPAGTIVASDGVTRFAAASLGGWGLGATAASRQMSFPSGVALSSTGRIAVADTDNSRISVFDPDAAGAVVASDGTRYRAMSFGQNGDSAGAQSAFEFNYPLDVAFDPSGRIVVADSANNQIKVYNATGTAAIAIIGGPAGLDKGSFNYPWGVSADATGNLLVADTFGQRLQVLVKTSTGYDANTPIELPPMFSPVGVVETADGGLAVSEFEYHRLVKLAPMALAIDGGVTLSSAHVASGDVVAAAFTVRNSGRAPLANVTPVLNGVAAERLVACSAGSSTPVSLTAGQTQRFTVCFRAPMPTPALQLMASATGANGPMQVTAPETAAPSIVVEAGNVAAMSVSAAVPTGRVEVNSVFTVDLRLVNEGRQALTNVTLGLPAVPGLTFVPQQSDALGPRTLAVGANLPLTLTFRATTLGARTLTVTATADQHDVDGHQLSATATASVDVVADATAPTIVSAVVEGPAGELPNAAGWIQYGPATLSVTALDAGSGLQSISYRAMTLATGTMNVPGGQHSATFAGGPFYSYGQGSTLVSFWAEDLAGNARYRQQVPLEVAPGVLETVPAFCMRLPAQCVTINIDPLKPALESWPATIAGDNTEARIAFNASDSQSGVASVRLAPNQTGARIDMDPGSTTRGTLVLTAEGEAVTADVIVSDAAGLENTFRLPLTGTGVAALRLDRTPPEAFNQLDPAALGKTCTTTIAGKPVKYLCTNKVYGTDDLPGLTAAAFAPVSVTAARWGGDYDTSADDFDDDDADGHWHRGVIHADNNHDGYCDFHRWSRYTDDHRYGYTIHDKDRDGHHDRNCRERHDTDDRRRAPTGYHWLRRAYQLSFWDRFRDNHSHWFCDHDHDWDGGVAELHTYTFTDAYTPAAGPAPVQNPNRVTLVEKVRQSGNEVRVRVMSYQYSQGSVAGPVIVPDWATKKYEWETDRVGVLKTLTQKMELGRGRDRVQVIASYDARTNKTTIRELGPDGTKQVVRTGLALLRMTTDDEQLTIAY